MMVQKSLAISLITSLNSSQRRMLRSALYAPAPTIYQILMLWINCIIKNILVRHPLSLFLLHFSYWYWFWSEGWKERQETSIQQGFWEGKKWIMEWFQANDLFRLKCFHSIESTYIVCGRLCRLRLQFVTTIKYTKLLCNMAFVLCVWHFHFKFQKPTQFLPRIGCRLCLCGCQDVGLRIKDYFWKDKGHLWTNIFAICDELTKFKEKFNNKSKKKNFFYNLIN